MALYHFHAEPVRRSRGHSTVNSAAYQARAKLYDERLDDHRDWTGKPGIVESTILAPSYAPAWMAERQKLWNENERTEKRKDSQTGMWYDIALPYELTDAQRRDLLHSFVRDTWNARGLVADIAIHAPDKDNRNWHAHVLLASRTVTPEGFGDKAFRGRLNHRRLLLEADREAWADHHNRYFDRLGLPQRIDHRSYEKQQIDREATKHLGPAASERLRKGDPTRIVDQNRDIEQRNSERAREYRDIHDEAQALREKERQIRAEPPRDIHAEAQATRDVIWVPSPRRPHAPPVAEQFNKPAEFKDRITRRWSERDHERRVALESREIHALLDLERKHQTQRIALQAEQAERNATLRGTMQAEVNAIDKRLEAKGIRRFMRKALGRDAYDRSEREKYIKTLAGIDAREKDELQTLTNRHKAETLRMIETYRHLRHKLEAQIEGRAEKQKEFVAERASGKQGRAQEGRPPPKLAPSLDLTPPGMAKPALPHITPAEYQRRVDAYATTGEGRAATQKPVQIDRDFRANSPPPPDKAPQPDHIRDAAKMVERQAPPRTKETPAEFFRPEKAQPASGDFFKSAKSTPEPRKDFGPAAERDPSKGSRRERSSFFNAAPETPRSEKNPEIASGRERTRSSYFDKGEGREASRESAPEKSPASGRETGRSRGGRE